MNRNLFAHGLAVLVMGILFGAYIKHDYEKWRRLGRDAFITHELERFDRFIAPPGAFGVAVFGVIVLTPFIFGFYELVAFALSSVLRSTIPDQTGPTGARGVPFT